MRVWKEEHEPEGKRLIPLRMVSCCVLSRTRPLLFVFHALQIPWEEDFTHSTARELFGSNLLALTWIKGEPLPGDLVTDILRGLELEQDTSEELRRRTTGASDAL